MNVGVDFNGVKREDGLGYAYAPIENSDKYCGKYSLHHAYCNINKHDRMVSVKYILAVVDFGDRFTCGAGMGRDDFSACLRKRSDAIDMQRAQLLVDLAKKNPEQWSELLIDVPALVQSYRWERPKGNRSLFDWGRVIEIDLLVQPDGKLGYRHHLRWNSSPSKSINPWQ